MKVVNVITPHFTPEITAAAHRMDAVVNSLSGEYKVNVFTLTERGKQAHRKVIQIADNVIVHYINLPSYPKSLFFIRALFEFYFSICLCMKASRSRADISLITVPYMFLLPVAAVLIRGGKKIADVRDLVWCYLPQRNRLQRFLRRSFTSLARISLRNFDHITVTNIAEKNWILQNTSFCESRVSILSNGIASEKFEKLLKMKYHGTSGPFVITYVGNIGNGQDLKTLIEVVKKMENVKLNIIGDGIEMKKLEHLIRTEKIRNIQLHGKLKWNRVLPFYQSSSVLFARLGENYQSAIPSKLFEYLSTGLPLVFQGRGVAADFLERFENAHIVEDESPEGLYDVLSRLMYFRPKRSEANPRMIGDFYLRELLNSRLFPVFSRLLENHEEQISVPQSVNLLLQEDVI